MGIHRNFSGGKFFGVFQGGVGILTSKSTQKLRKACEDPPKHTLESQVASAPGAPPPPVDTKYGRLGVPNGIEILEYICQDSFFTLIKNDLLFALNSDR